MDTPTLDVVQGKAAWLGRPSTYSPEFEHDAVALVRTTGKPVNQAARALGISHETLRNWVLTGSARTASTAATAHRAS